MQSIPEPVAQPQTIAATSTPSDASPSSSSTSSNPEETRQKIRSLMGLILKHRGGPGFGKGRLKGPEIDQFDTVLKEVSSLLREEAKMAQPVDNPLTNTAPPPVATMPEPVMVENPVESSPQVPVQNHIEPPPQASVSTSTSAPGSIDSTIACIEGAVTMYKNSPPELKESVLLTLRAALNSAINTCNSILVSQPPPAIRGNPNGLIDNTIAVIDGAVTMYKNSPPELQESVLVTLRAALISAVETCDNVLGPNQAFMTPAEPSTPVVAPVPAAASVPSVSSTPPPPSPPAASSTHTDAYGSTLEGIYDKVLAASGDGKFGLRSDLTASEANELAESLVEMRKTLMKELETVIPSPSTVKEEVPVAASNGASESSSISKYQQMLAKARAEKAAG